MTYPDDTPDIIHTTCAHGDSPVTCEACVDDYIAARAAEDGVA